MSNITREYRAFAILFSFLSFILTLGPIIYFTITGYIEADLTKEKVVLTCTVMCAIILTVINVIFKHHIRSTIWLLVLGIYYCLDNIMPLLLMVAIGTIIDEFLITPLKKSFKSKYAINHEIDKRL